MSRFTSLLARSVLVLLTIPVLIGTALGDRPAKTTPARLPSAEDLGLPSPEALAADLLDQFQRIYNGRDSDAYVAMFDPWVFSYEFSPLDKQWGGPEAWAYAEEVRTAREMFTDLKTTRIELRLEQQEVLPASITDGLPAKLELNGLWKVSAAAYLDVDRETPRGTEHHGIRGHTHAFYFRRGTEDEGWGVADRVLAGYDRPSGSLEFQPDPIALLFLVWSVYPLMVCPSPGKAQLEPAR